VRVVTRAEVDVEQLLFDLLVAGMQVRGLLQRPNGLVRAPLFGQLGGDLFQIAESAALVAHLDPCGDRREAAVVIVGIDGAESDLRLERAARIAARLSKVHQQFQVRAGVGVEPLHCENVGDLRQRVFVIRLELEDLLVERTRLGGLAFVAQVVRDLDELLDSLVGVTRAGVHVAERVLRGPVLRLILDDAHVLRDGGIELPLPDQLLGIAKRCGAINWHNRSSA
jgi:hypothetical protein